MFSTVMNIISSLPVSNIQYLRPVFVRDLVITPEAPRTICGSSAEL